MAHYEDEANKENGVTSQIEAPERAEDIEIDNEEQDSQSLGDGEAI